MRHKRKRLLKTVVSIIMLMVMVFTNCGMSNYANVYATESTEAASDKSADKQEEKTEKKKETTEKEKETTEQKKENATEEKESRQESDQKDSEKKSEDATEASSDEKSSTEDKEESATENENDSESSTQATEDQTSSESSTETTAEETTEEEIAYKAGTLKYNGSDFSVQVKYTELAEIPEGAKLKVTEIKKNSSQYNRYMDKAADAVGIDDQANTEGRFFDITILVDGKEYEPKDTVTVKISYDDPMELTDNSETGAVHFIDGGGTQVGNVDTNGGSSIDEVSFKANSFSVYGVIYTVDFTYDGYTYSIAGESSIKLSKLAEILGIAGDGKDYESGKAFVKAVEDVDFTDESLVKVSKDGEDWVLKSLKPFNTDEVLTVTMASGDKYVITVTDTQESTELSNFLTNATISGAIPNGDGTYTVETGKDYSIALSFAEDANYQFDNDATLTYTMPDGITIINAQSGEFNINIVYKGKTYQVDATYNLDTNGNLTIKFDENDPDYHNLVASTNVSFRFTYHAQFDGSETKIKFNDEVERDIVFDEPKPGEAFAEKSAVYNEKTGTFTYTIKVTADGDVTNVNVKDVISGDALIFNNDVRVSGNSSSYTDNNASNGFDYTFASMAEGEEITITYTASVDFSKDTDKDGKITADQTKNTVTVQPEDGPPHPSEYSREISYKSTKKSNASDAGTTADGDKILSWTITYNELALAAAAGDKIKDTISSSSTEYMKYYGDGITVKVYDKNDTLVETRNVSYSDLTPYSDSSWTYTIPSTDTTPYYYEITYQTVVDQDKVDGGGTAVTVSNDANGSGGSGQVGPAGEIGVTKAVDTSSTEEVTWISTITVPENGLTQALVTDTVPSVWLESGRAYDFYKDGSLEITGLLDGESYDVDTSDTSKVVINFYKDSGKTQTGLQGTSGGHTIFIKLTTKVDQDWLQAGYDTPGWLEQHTNNISFNGKTASATAIFGKPGIEKTGQKYDAGIMYSIRLAGISETPVSIEDTFDTDILELDTSKSIYIYGGNQYYQGSGETPVSYSDTSTGILLTANTVPMDADGHYYPYYRITYYLKLKDGVDLDKLAQANGGKYDLVNTAKWGDHESSYTYTTEYDYLDKELLNKGELGGTNRTAEYKITFNKAKATLNDGQPMIMTDTLSASLSLDYSSINIVTDPGGAQVSYSASGNDAGETIVTYNIPDETAVTITYKAMVVGNGSVKITNKVSVNGKDETVEETKDYGSAGEGEGAVASFKIVKVDGYDATKKLAGVKFKIFCEDPTIPFDDAGTKELILITDENGEIVLDGEQYDFYFNKCYHVQEIEGPDNYGKISFDYLVTLTNDMSHVDYGHYIYYYSDSMQIKNWPLEGLVVEKQVESEDEADLDRYYTFKLSILNDDGSVNTNYNETNGDDEFENGVVEFKLKAGEQKMFWGFDKGTKYKVEEIDAEGFVTTVSYDVFDDEGNVTSHKTDTSTSHSGTLTQDDETIVFKNSKTNEKGSLKITKNVTVNGAATDGTLADGTYKFTLKDADGNAAKKVDGTNVGTIEITIENGKSSTAEVTDLAPGKYTITEATPTNGTSLTGNNNIEVTVVSGATVDAIPVAEFTNNLDQPGSLKIIKNVTVNGAATTGTLADGTYTFIIKDSAGNPVNGSIGETAITDGKVTLTIENGVSQEVVVTGLAAGTYTITEETPENGTKVTGANPVTVTVKKGELVPTDLAIGTFTNNLEPGSLKITKNVTVNGEATTGTLADGTYEFTIKDADNNAAKKIDGTDVGTISITIENGESTTAEVTDLAPGKYTITEATPTNGTSLVGENGITVTVVAGKAGNDVAAAGIGTFTNNLEPGSLKITKNVTVNGEATTGKLADGTYKFTVKDSEGKAAKKADGTEVGTIEIMITNGVASTEEVTDLLPGKYTITEATPTNGTSLSGSNDIEVTVVAGQSGDDVADAGIGTFTNNIDVGSLKITKKVTVNGETTTTTLADGTYQFTITDSEGKAAKKADGTAVGTISIKIENGVASTAEVTDLLPGEYTITETTPTNGTSLTGSNDIKVTVVAGATGDAIPVAEFTNNLDQPGSLKIIKNVTVNGKTTTGTLADGTYTFIIKDSAGNPVNGSVGGTPITDGKVTLTIANGVSQEVVVTGLAAGTYTITEETPENETKVTGANPVTVTVKKGELVPTGLAIGTFTNNLEFGSLKITKNVTVNGETTTGTLADGTYQFTITDSKGKAAKKIDGTDVGTISITITNGESTTTEVTNLLPGKYTITEAEPTNGTTLTSGNNIEVTVVAGQSGDDVADAGIGTFTNDLYQTKGDITFSGKKVLENRTLKEGEFSFELYDSKGTLLETVTNKADGSYSFTKINYTGADLDKDADGNYVETTKTYKVVEKAGEDSTITYDTTEYEITVTLSDDGKGKITATADPKENTYDFTNTYKTKGDITFSGKKKLVNRKLKEGEFSFELYDSKGTLLETVTNAADGSYSFTKINYTGADLDKDADGNYVETTKTYKVVEKAGEDASVTYDDTEYEITVTLSDDGKGKITATADPKENTYDFTNTYQTKGDITFSGKKKLVNRKLKEGEFSFELYDSEGTLLETVTNKADGSYSFTKINYTGADLDKDADGNYVETTKTYKVVEKTGSDASVTYATTEYEITVTLTDNGKGKITAVADPKENTYDFTNTYQTKGDITFSGKKVLENRTLKEGEFSFELYDSEGTLLETVTNKADGSYSFTKINYTGADLDKDADGNYVETTKTYKVVEKAGEDSTITYDTTEYEITVTLSDDGKGKITATADPKENTYDFTNTYKTKGDITFSGKKKLANRKLKEGEFSFELYDFEGTLLETVTNAADGSYSFTKINYTGADLDKDADGNYVETIKTYKVVEKAGEDASVTYDDTEYEITVTLKEDGKGKITATADPKENTYDFTNTYKTKGDITFSGKKKLVNRKLKEGEFSFELYDSKGTLLETVTNAADGSYSFTKINYTGADLDKDADGNYVETIKTYKVVEKAGEDASVTYDDTEYEITVTLSDDGKGKITATADPKENTYDFTNTYKTKGDITFSGTKKLANRKLKEGEFSFELYDSEGTLLETVTNKADGSYSFTKINYTGADLDKDADGNYVETTKTYKVIEKAGEDASVTYDDTEYEITVTLTDDGKGTINTSADPEENTYDFTNTYSTKGDITFSGTKELQHRTLKEGEFSFELYDSEGKLLETVKNAADGSYSFSTIKYTGDDLDTDQNGYYVETTKTYKVVEKAGDDSSVTYDGTEYKITVTLTDNGKGTINTSADPKENTYDFTNVYKTKGDITFHGTKELKNRTLKKGEFSFELYEVTTEGENTKETLIETVTNEADGSYSFSKIKYTGDDMLTDTDGNYVETTKKYIVHEKPGTNSSVTYDNAEYEITVTLTDDGKGNITAKATPENGTYKFTNIYEAEGSITFAGKKTLKGATLKAGQFTFEVLDSDGNVIQEVTNTANGKIQFEKISYTQDDIGTHTYTVREVTPDDDDIKCKTKPYKVTVTVKDLGNGKLKVTATNNAKKLNFVNEKKGEKKKSSSSKTGDHNNILGTFLLAIMSLAAAIFLLIRRRRELSR